MRQLTNCASKMPMTMVSWFRETSRPRFWAGATSAIYMGDRFDARPMAAPPAIRQRINTAKDPASPVATEDTANSRADKASRRLRPKRSLSAPDTKAPMRQPSSALLRSERPRQPGRDGRHGEQQGGQGEQAFAAKAVAECPRHQSPDEATQQRAALGPANLQ